MLRESHDSFKNKGLPEIEGIVNAHMRAYGIHGDCHQLTPWETIKLILELIERLKKQESQNGQANKEDRKISHERSEGPQEPRKDGQEEGQGLRYGSKNDEEGEEEMKKNGTIKKVISHLKEDTKEFKEQIADDKKLKKELTKKGKKR